MIEHSYFWNLDKNARIRENIVISVEFDSGNELRTQLATELTMELS